MKKFLDWLCGQSDYTIVRCQKVTRDELRQRLNESFDVAFVKGPETVSPTSLPYMVGDKKCCYQDDKAVVEVISQLRCVDINGLALVYGTPEEIEKAVKFAVSHMHWEGPTG